MGDTNKNFKLGERVRILGHTKKRSDWQVQHNGGVKYPRMEHPPEVNDAWGKSANADYGIVVGRRTVTEGQTQDYDEYGRNWIPTPGTAQRVWIVAYDLRLKPIMAFPDQLESLDTGLDIRDTEA